MIRHTYTPVLPAGERLVNPALVDVLAVPCPECHATPGQACLPAGRKTHVLRRLDAYAAERNVVDLAAHRNGRARVTSA